MTKRPRRYFIKPKEAHELFRAYGYRVKTMNWYQLRIWPEESKDMWDWYHTQGSVVVTRDGFPARFGTYGDAEDLAIAIQKDVYQLA